MFVEGFFVGAAGDAFRRGSVQRDVAFGPIVNFIVTARNSSWAPAPKQGNSKLLQNGIKIICLFSTFLHEFSLNKPVILMEFIFIGNFGELCLHIEAKETNGDKNQ